MTDESLDDHASNGSYAAKKEPAQQSGLRFPPFSRHGFTWPAPLSCRTVIRRQVVFSVGDLEIPTSRVVAVHESIHACT